MEEKNEKHVLLGLMHRGAFAVENGVITHINAAASRYFLQEGTQIATLLATGKEEYADFSGQCLYLTLNLEGRFLGATVVRADGIDIFLLEEEQESSQLQVLSLAAMELRQPLAGAMAVTDRMLPELSAQQHENAAQLNRRMMQLQRIISNMADCAEFGTTNLRMMEYVEVCSFVEEILAPAAQALLQAGIKMDYSLPDGRIYTLANPQKLERAIYNILSNAAKFSPDGGSMQVQLVQRGERLFFSVTDQGPGIRESGDVFTRYLRQPTLEDPRFGLGLGMALIRSAASLHGGAVLIDHPEGGGTRVTMTIAISQNKTTDIHSPVFRIDYAGEKDHCLLELSDVLPAKLYRTES